HRACGLPEAAHPAHAVEQARRESTVAKQVIVEKVQVTARQPIDFSKCGINRLRVKTLPAFEEGFLVAEVADMRTSARNDDGIGDQIEMTANQIAANRRHAIERSDG